MLIECQQGLQLAMELMTAVQLVWMQTTVRLCQARCKAHQCCSTYCLPLPTYEHCQPVSADPTFTGGSSASASCPAAWLAIACACSKTALRAPGAAAESSAARLQTSRDRYSVWYTHDQTCRIQSSCLSTQNQATDSLAVCGNRLLVEAIANRKEIQMQHWHT